MDIDRFKESYIIVKNIPAYNNFPPLMALSTTVNAIDFLFKTMR